MKRINTLFGNSAIEAIAKVESETFNSKSEVARAAMSIGLEMISVARESMTDREFHNYISNHQMYAGELVLDK